MPSEPQIVADREDAPSSRVLLVAAKRDLENIGAGPYETERDLCHALDKRGIATTLLTARDIEKTLPETVATFRPSVAIASRSTAADFAKLCVAVGIPTIPFLSDIELYWFERACAAGAVAPGAGDGSSAARDTARILEANRRIFPFFIEPESCRTETSRRRVLFCNPIQSNGLDIAVRLATARPDIPFDFVETWPLSASYWTVLKRRVSALPNIRLRPRTADMRPTFAVAKLLLAPGGWQGSVLRAVAEAQCSAIPVLARSEDRFAEAVGPGGILVDPGVDFHEWQSVLSQFWDDEGEYARLSAAALAHSRRPEIEPPALLDRLIDVLARHAADGPRRAGPHTSASRATTVVLQKPVRIPSLSIVIPTYGRPERLDRLLNSLHEQLANSPNRQCIVVNDGSRDAAYADVVERHNGYIDYVALPSNRGPGGARNAGAKRARGEYLVFVDDDCVAEGSWLDRLEAILAENPDIDVAGGVTRPLFSESPGLLEKSLAARRAYPLPVCVGDDLLLMVTACMAVRRKGFERIGGFDETMRTTEDRNLTYRMKQDRAVFFLDWNWSVLHEMSASLRQSVRRFYEYGRGIRAEIEFENKPMDLSDWPIDDRSFGYWVRNVSNLTKFIAAATRGRPRGLRLRVSIAVVIFLTHWALMFGFLRGSRGWRMSR